MSTPSEANLLINYRDRPQSSEENAHSHSPSQSCVNTPFLTDLNRVSNDSEERMVINGIRRISSEIICEDTDGLSSEDDTIASRIDLQRISTRSRTSEKSKHSRKESFEQRLRRTFTIKNAETSEFARRLLAIVIKYSLFVFNFVSWVFAVTAIGLGIWLKVDKTLLVTTDTQFYFDLPLMTCVGGGVTFIVALLGCIGALRENLILLKVFFFVLTIIWIGEMILAVAVFIIYAVPEARDNFLRSQPEKILHSAIVKYMDDIEIKQWVDKIQSEFKCCGISSTEEGFRDWKISQYFNCSSVNKSIYRCAVPMSCCIFEKGDRVNTMCGFDMTDKPLIDVRDYIYTRGCIIGFGEWLGKYNDFIIIACLSILIMQFLAVLSARMMVRWIQKRRQQWKLLLQRSASSSANTFTRNILSSSSSSANTVSRII